MALNCMPVFSQKQEEERRQVVAHMFKQLFSGSHQQNYLQTQEMLAEQLDRSLELDNEISESMDVEKEEEDV